jgi:hypothetical protein
MREDSPHGGESQTAQRLPLAPLNRQLVDPLTFSFYQTKDLLRCDLWMLNPRRILSGLGCGIGGCKWPQ